MKSWHNTAEKTAAAGTIRHHTATFTFPSPYLPPTTAELGFDAVYSPTLTAAQCHFSPATHFHHCIPQINEQAPDSRLHLRIVARLAGVVHRDLTGAASSTDPQATLTLKNLVDCLDRQSFAIFTEYFRAAGTSGQHCLDPSIGEPLQQVTKNSLEVPHTPQIVGGFRATGQDNPKRRYRSAQLLVDLPGDLWPRARKTASREENRITVIWQVTGREETRST
jgi:hypothetical protein